MRGGALQGCHNLKTSQTERLAPKNLNRFIWPGSSKEQWWVEGYWIISQGALIRASIGAHVVHSVSTGGDPQPCIPGVQNILEVTEHLEEVNYSHRKTANDTVTQWAAAAHIRSPYKASPTSPQRKTIVCHLCAAISFDYKTAVRMKSGWHAVPRE